MKGNMRLAERIESLYYQQATSFGPEYFEAFEQLKQGLNSGSLRAAEPVEGESTTGWKVNAWVKMGILLGFRIGVIESISGDGALAFLDKHTFPLKKIGVESGVRVVPGGSSIRDGCYVGRGVTCMPPMYINAGAYVDEGTMIDSHALVGSCAQVGRRVHLSAGSQLGGVLEPVGALPVIVEDDVLIGGNCGIYEGTVVKRGAVIGAGTILTGSTPLYDLVRGQLYRRRGETPLVVPSDAVVVPGSRAVSAGWGCEQGISIYTPVIVKYRDSKTDASIRLEDILR
ncbi:MAG: 2,3,4,5-tetrahydropyridine-2,6-dicarboxylate N-succinyltransferase [Acidobacteria bacterium RIFCSPLOWO2_02_FULL_59_13]|nr:MAG: 2,3,4,5-tetrahydropyridine-2,6-dicarboxylate N-succinyltransferase [Acidobacteria bacterium RIFCSPLOWO2_02_FULL_59_13]